MPRRVEVVPHDPRWARRFRGESALISEALAPNVIAVHHVGSTAIPGIHAKPIIDMIVEVEDITRVDAKDLAMAVLGYEGLGEYGIPGRRYFRKFDESGAETHHVHTFETGSRDVQRHLEFRDFMIEHPDWASRYSSLKRALAEAHPDDIESYMDGKDAFIKEAEQLARTWRSRG
jgi:GrpB-like predicted nucleotidyltransferase (UPF0157 family)